MGQAFGRKLAALAMAASIAGCGKPAALSIENAWVRLPAVPGRPAAAYFTLQGGAADATLVRVETTAARSTGMHRSSAAGMRPLASVAVPAEATVAFAPGEQHVMLFDPDPRLSPGGTAPLVLSFADGRRLSTTARLVGPGDPAP